METVNRKPFQGIGNILQFNWHFYALAAALIALLLLSSWYTSTEVSMLLTAAAILIAGSTFVSLAVSYYVYDFSTLYQFSWLDHLPVKQNATIMNVHAGFDETSALLAQKFKDAKLTVLDFYHPQKHTELSIKRARKKYKPYPGTMQINTTEKVIANEPADYIFLFFAAHEIRNRQERIQFFKTLYNSLSEEGKIVVMEHLRDQPNFIAYNFGFLHFYAKSEWSRTFAAAGLTLKQELKQTPFISVFILQKNGITP